MHQPSSYIYIYIYIYIHIHIHTCTYIYICSTFNLVPCRRLSGGWTMLPRLLLPTRGPTLATSPMASDGLARSATATTSTCRTHMHLHTYIRPHTHTWRVDFTVCVDHGVRRRGFGLSAPPGGAADATIRHVIQRKDLQRLGDMPASVNPSIVSAKGLAIRIMDHVDEPAVVTILR